MKLRSLWLSLCLVIAWASSARAWEPFRSPNPNVERGNTLLKEGKTEDAIEAYTAAARELPDRAGVHLNRGLALGKAGRGDEAREALELATRSKGDPSVRAEAYYNLGRNFLDEANGLADAEDLEGAQGQLREARDAFRQALRNRPGFRDAAWNLELVQRRLVELEKQQQEQEQQQQQDQEEKDEQQGDEQQSGDGQDDEQQQDDEQKSPQDEQNQDEGQDGQPDSQQPEQQQGDQESQESEPQDSKQPGDSKDQPQDNADQPSQPQQNPTDPQQQPSQPQPDAREPLPQHVKQVLDALQDGEETLQSQQARSRARRRPRRVEKDW